MPGKRILVLLLLQLSCCFSSGSCGKVLVWPMEYSHWINMKVILDELILRGHDITVVRPSYAIFVDSDEQSSIKFETFPSSSKTDEMITAFREFVELWTYELPRTTCLAYSPLLESLYMKFSDTWLNICKEAALNKELMARLRKARFDVLIADAIGACGELLSELLEIPLVYTLRFYPGYTTEKYSGGLLVPPSYVPVILSGLSGQMTFMERVENFICMLYFDFWFETYNSKKWSNFYSEVLGHPTTLLKTMSRADIWLIRSYWDLEFPRPTLPNFDFVGGLHCKPAKPLPKEMEDFVQSSGDNGVVVFSLGSMIDNLTEDTANAIASALAQIPQKILWRFNGKKPDSLGKNTRLYKWLPQNDLLGHPKMKAFITHGGANGIYEAIHHGVPMVGIPLFGEQHDNIAHMVAKGAAVQLDIRTLSSKDLLRALETVINNPLYKKNAMWLSTIHHDQPMKPLDRAVFWIEFVMRNKGAKHLRPLAHNLTWYQYHSLDVIGFLLAGVATVMFLVIKCCLLAYQTFDKMGKKKKRE
ncbi:UDP-glucuronosyltransferase 2B17-like isoform X2 [Perognathus longimembris pacificus]|uniref:UDP-glucuronosyltransferase 2B17-like isoform X2 n=1 Tax=Perognathus longimembris pacificus TaxID=214514 RepID=UPI0020190B77|nr:UDP-glucuronosyltransferase 2B17-like isoform X2 [Perognathus longimembris pacificus]